MRVIAAAIRNPIAVCVTVLLVCLFGALSLLELPLQLFPDIERPTIGIFTNWRGASPEEAEAELLEPQERVSGPGFFWASRPLSPRTGWFSFRVSLSSE